MPDFSGRGLITEAKQVDNSIYSQESENTAYSVNSWIWLLGKQNDLLHSFHFKTLNKRQTDLAATAAKPEGKAIKP